MQAWGFSSEPQNSVENIWKKYEKEVGVKILRSSWDKVNKSEYFQGIF